MFEASVMTSTSNDWSSDPGSWPSVGDAPRSTILDPASATPRHRHRDDSLEDQNLISLFNMAGKAPIVVPALKRHTATVIVAHGLGDSGAGWYVNLIILTRNTYSRL